MEVLQGALIVGLVKGMSKDAIDQVPYTLKKNQFSCGYQQSDIILQSSINQLNSKVFCVRFNSKAAWYPSGAKSRVRRVAESSNPNCRIPNQIIQDSSKISLFGIHDANEISLESIQIHGGHSKDIKSNYYTGSTATQANLTTGDIEILGSNSGERTFI